MAMYSALDDVLRVRTGAFRRREALEAGFTNHQIRSLLDSGDWISRGFGVYVTRDVLDACSSRVEERHLLDAESVLLASPEFVLSHESAALYHSLDFLRRKDDRVQTTWAKRSRRTPRAGADVNVHCARLPRSQVRVEGDWRVTTVGRTVADVARGSGVANGLVVGNSALSRGQVTRGEIEDVLAGMKGWPGVRQARRILPWLDARAQTPLESLCLNTWMRLGLPRPELQVWVFDEFGFVGIVDGLWLGSFVVYEADGRIKYRELGRDDTLVKQHERQERLEQCGLCVQRVVWDHVWASDPAFDSAVVQAFTRPTMVRYPRCRLYVGDRDQPAPDPGSAGRDAFEDPAILGLRLVYDGLRFPRYWAA